MGEVCHSKISHKRLEVQDQEEISGSRIRYVEGKAKRDEIKRDRLENRE
jgi:hypothetical protein